MKEDVQVDLMRGRLRELYAEDPEERLLENVVRQIEDPLKPRSENGRFRVNPILVLLMTLAALAVGAFLYFSFGGV